MLFPKNQVLHENLNTSFTQLDALLAELRSNQFTGYVQITGWEYKGILLFDTGRIINASEDAKGQSRQGPTAAAGIAVKGREKDNAISVYRLSAEVTQVLANLLVGEPIYKDLSSDLTGLDKLVAKLQSERLTGAINARSMKKQNAATILMRDGQVLECTLSSQGNVTSGQILDKIIQAMLDDAALFTVYRTDMTRVYSPDLDLADSFARPGMMVLWQTVLQMVETTTDGSVKSGAFNSALRRACIGLATNYPFLDPFAGEFEYREGQIKFEGQATVAQFNAGLSQCLAQTVRELATQSATQDLLKQLQTATTSLKEGSEFQLEQVGLTTALPEVFAS
jgi:hypothetical protein